MIKIEDVVRKFSAVPSKLTRKEQIVPEYLTEEEFALLPQCPRQGTVESLSKWPKIGGRRVYPLSGALNAEEKTRYNELKKEQRQGLPSSGGTSVRGGLSKSEIELNDKLDSLIELLGQQGASDACIKAAEALKIKEPNKLLLKLLGTEDIPATVSRYALMFRRHDGSRLPLDISAVDFAQEAVAGLRPVYNNDTLCEALAELKTQGIELDVV